MIALYLLAAHLVGDYVLATRWQAARKLTEWRIRLDHCIGYTIPFVVVALVVGDDYLAWYAFPAAIFVAHFLTDSRRFHSSIGDWVGWYFRHEHAERDGLGNYRWPRLPANPWEPLPLMIDQTLHVVQIAVLAGLLLR